MATVYIQCGFGSAFDDVFCELTTWHREELPPLPNELLAQLDYAKRELDSGRARRGRRVQTLASTIGDAIQAVNDYAKLRGNTTVGANPLLALLRSAWKIERSINGENEPFEYGGRFIPGAGWPVSCLNDLVTIFAVLREAVNSIWELFGCTAACMGAPILFAGPLHDGGLFLDVVGWKLGATTDHPDREREVPDSCEWLDYLQHLESERGQAEKVVPILAQPIAAPAGNRHGGNGQAEEGDPDAYVGASELRTRQFRSRRKFDRAIKQNPWIRTKRNGCGHLSVYRPDWDKFLNRETAAVLAQEFDTGPNSDPSLPEIYAQAAKQRESRNQPR